MSCRAKIGIHGIRQKVAYHSFSDKIKSIFLKQKEKEDVIEKCNITAFSVHCLKKGKRVWCYMNNG